MWPQGCDDKKNSDGAIINHLQGNNTCIHHNKTSHHSQRFLAKGKHISMLASKYWTIYKFNFQKEELPKNRQLDY